MFRDFSRLLKNALWRRSSAKELVIEDLKDGDVERISDIHRVSFVRGWSDGEIEKMLAAPGYFCLVARTHGNSTKTLKGFVIVRGVLDEAEVITIAVKPAARRRQIARRLMEASIRRLLSDRYKTFFLEVAAGNKPARTLYENLGFKVVSDRKGYYQTTPEADEDLSNALVMRLDLG